MKKCSVNLLKYGLAKHLKEAAQIDINIDPVFASSKGVFSKWERIHWLENYLCNSQNIEANMW